MRKKNLNRLRQPMAYLRQCVWAILLTTLLGLALPTTAQAATITVTTDTIGGPGCDLAEAIDAANSDTAIGDCSAGSGADTIVFNTPSDTITLTAVGSTSDSYGDNGLPVITSPLTIDGSPGGITITRDNAASAFRILEVRGFGGSGGKLTLNQVTIHNGRTSGSNVDSDAEGGGLLIRNGAALTLTNSTIISNTANSYGGGIRAKFDSPVTVVNSTIISNVADSTGGGIHAYFDSSVMVTDSTIVSNKANANGGSDGGGITTNVDTPLTVANSTIISNTGGGINVNNRSPLTVTDSTISYNTTTGNGGGIDASFDCLVMVTNSVIASNTAGSHGGGIDAQAGSSAVVDSTIIQGNSANADGGGIYISKNLTVTNSTIISNTADDHGGGIFARDDSSVTVDSSVIQGNGANESGGGIAVIRSDFGGITVGRTLTVTNSTIASNEANENGGGIYAMEDATLMVDSSIIEANTANGSGGGIYAHKNNSVRVSNSTISSNTANSPTSILDGGGGIYVSRDSSVTVANSNIISNKANSSGGGISVQGNSSVKVDSSIINANTAVSGVGGGIYTVNGSPITVAGSAIFSNTANNFIGGGIAAAFSSPVMVASSTIQGNTARDGGGIAVQSHNPLTVTSSTIISNTAEHGGGLAARNDSPVTVDSSTIKANTADSGGGIHATEYSPATVISSTLIFNIAKYGGGIFAGSPLLNSDVISVENSVTVTGSTIFSNITNLTDNGTSVVSDSLFTLANSPIETDIANDNGGVIYVSQGTTVTVVANSTIISNVADSGGGIYASQGTTVRVANSRLLTNNAGTGGALYRPSFNEEPVNITDSCIVGNSANAIHNDNPATTITTQSNWWGATTGPGAILSGSGDTVSTGVDGSNFLTAPILDCPTLGSATSLASLGDFVFNDLNADGIQDSNEPGIGGIQVILMDAQGTEQTTTTDDNGRYAFTDLTPGDYTVTFVLPNGATASPQDQGSDDSVDSDIDSAGIATVTLEAGQANDTIDAGLLFINPQIVIHKESNPAQILVGGTANFTITVQNVGDVTLTGITVADPLAPGCARSVPDLAPSESHIYSCQVADIPVDFVNVATVTAANHAVSDEDDAPIDVIAPAISITKSPDLQRIESGQVAEFTIVVANTGDVALTDVVVTDPLAPSCDKVIGDLAAGASQSYTCSLVVSQGFTNIISVQATTPLGSIIEGQDEAVVEVLDPSLSVVKSPSIQVLLPGETATFTIIVTNNGGTDINDVTLADDRCDRLTWESRGNGDNDLAVNEEWTYTCEIDNVTAKLFNTATASGTIASSGEPIEETSNEVEANIFQANPSIDVQKSTDTPIVYAGSTVTFTINILNDGDVPLSGIEVIDPMCPVVPTRIDAGDNDPLNQLAPGEVWVYYCIVTNVQDKFVNEVEVFGQPLNGALPEISDRDDARVDVIDPSLSIQKGPAKQTIISGSDVVFTITVKNDGDALMTGVVVSDNQCDLISPADTGPFDLAINEERTFTCTIQNVTTALTNVASVIGYDPLNNPWEETASADVNVINPSIDIEKSPEKQVVLGGINVVFEIVVTNDGDVPLTDVVMDDPRCDTLTPVLVAPLTLQPGESQTFICTVMDVQDHFVNVATATGTGPNGTTVSAEDSAQVRIYTLSPQPSLDLSKSPDYQEVTIGEDALFTIEVTNNGNVTIRDLEVTDPLCNPLVRVDNGSGSSDLTVGETWRYECTVPNVQESFTNIAVAEGFTLKDVNNADPITATDSAEVNILRSGLNVVKTPKKQTVPVGGTATFTIAVTNNGPTALDNVELHDPECTTIVSPTDTILDPGETWNYTCTRTNVERSFTNVAWATACFVDNPDSCIEREGPTAIDAMLVIDRSGSMGGAKIKAAVDSAINFIGRANATVDRIGVASFSDQGALDIGLTSDFAAVEGILNGLSAGGGTDIATGMKPAIDEILANRSERVPILILLSDGRSAHVPIALAEATRACEADIQVYTIGLGPESSIDVPTLTQMACNGGTYQRTENPADLGAIYERIAIEVREPDETNVDEAEVNVIEDHAAAISIGARAGSTDDALINLSGGPVTYYVQMANTSQPYDPLTITSLTDDVYGDLLDPANPNVYDNSCATTTIAPGGAYVCQFTANVDKQYLTTNVTVVAVDDEGERVIDQDDTTVALMGDVDCNQEVDNVDALKILRYDVGLIQVSKIKSCSLEQPSVNLYHCKYTEDQEGCDPVQSLFILLCDVGHSNILCPSTDPTATAFERPAIASSVSLNTATIPAGANGSVSVPVHLSPNDGMINAATVEIHYDSALLRPTGCTADPDSLYELAECNAHYADGAVRLAALSSDGVDSSNQLAALEFEVIGDLAADAQLDMHVVKISGDNGVALPVMTESSLGISQVAWDTFLPVILK